MSESTRATSMTDYIEVEEAIDQPGLRVVLTPGIPGPWSESAKAILRVKGLAHVAARQDVLGPNPALRRWSGQTSAPVVAWKDEPPRSNWLEQLYLFERLAPEPRMVPSDFETRVEMLGLANELMGDDGFIAARRHIMVRDFTRADQDPDTRKIFTALGEKYGYCDAAAAKAPHRGAEILAHFAARLGRIRQGGGRYLMGECLTALDLYWAAAAALIEPLPQSDCPMTPLFRSVYTNTDPVVAQAADPALLEHRDFVYEQHVGLPLEL